MKVYLVGGAVRDALLGLTPKDKDYVVVGADEKEMIDLGYSKVGESFPVFLNPDNNFEYALARKERKIPGANAHTAFSFDYSKDVTLEEDLYRRDLTINAMAYEGDEFNIWDSSKQIVDPYNGFEDLKNKVLRHVSDAFSEDPLRVLRVARFAARYPEFSIAEETLELMRKITSSPDFKTLPQERINKEMVGALFASKPSIFFNVLKDVGGLEHYFPELHALIDVPQRADYHPEGDCWIHTMLVLDAARKFDDIRITFAALVHDLGKGITPKEILPSHYGHETAGIPLVKTFCKRLKIPNEWRDAALVVTRNHLKVHMIEVIKPKTIVKMFGEMDAYRRQFLVPILARACEADDFGKNKTEVRQGVLLESYFEAIKDVGFKDVKDTRPGLAGESIKEEIRLERIRRLKQHIRSLKGTDENAA